jgi:hypothetical protein
MNIRFIEMARKCVEKRKPRKKILVYKHPDWEENCLKVPLKYC